jgi:Tfp pilus assembly protein PilX
LEEEMENLDKQIDDRKRAGESGIALALVLLVLLSLSVLIISAHYTNVTQTYASSNYRNSTQAYFIAEAGIQRTIDWFSHKYIPPDWKTTSLKDTVYPNLLTTDPAVLVILLSEGTGSTFPVSGMVSGSADSFQEYLQATNKIEATTIPGLEGRYTIRTTLLSTKMVDIFPSGQQRVERWRIESTGLLRNNKTGNELARADNVAVIETMVKPAFLHAICADSFDLNGQTVIDSYDSTAGAYGGSNSGGPASLGSYSNSTGPFDFGNVEIEGSIDIPPPYQSAPDEEPCNQGTEGCGTNYCPELPPVPNFSIGKGGKSPYRAYSSADCTFTFGTPGSCPSVITGATGDDVNGGTISLANAPGFTGSGAASFWAKEIGGNVLIDNNTGRIGDGPLNVFVEEIDGSVRIKNRAPAQRNSVNIFVKTKIKLSGGDSINGTPFPGANVSGLRLFLAPGVKVTISGNADITAIIYGPDVTADLGNGKVDFYGVVIAGDLFRKNGTTGGIHFDRQLEESAFSVFNFVPNSEVRRIY